jgi:hypothetical protein
MAFQDDDFEFKPLSEGLGFHKKVIDLQDHHESGHAQHIMPLQQNVPAFNPSLRNKSIIETKKSGAPPATRTASNPSLGTGINSHAQLWGKSHQRPQAQTNTQRVDQNKINQKNVVHGVRDNLLASATSWPAAIFDSTMVLGLVLVFSAAIFAITRIDLSELIEMLRTEGAAQISAVILLVSVYGMYTVTCRTFFGKTLGDSVFYYQLGTPQDQASVIYPVKVFFRSLLIAFTGFILLPLLSTILNKDVAGILSGVSIYAETK